MEICGRAELFEHLVDGGDVIPRKAFALVLAPEDVAEFLEVLEGRGVVVGPDGLGASFGLETPFAAETFGAGLAFFAVFGDGFPDVNISHRQRVPVARARGYGKEREKMVLDWPKACGEAQLCR